MNDESRDQDGTREVAVATKPYDLYNAGYAVTKAYGAICATKSQFVGMVNDARVVSVPALSTYAVDSQMINVSQRVAFRTYEQPGYLRSSIGLNQCVDDRLALDRGVQLSINSAFTGAAPVVPALRPDAIFMGDQLHYALENSSVRTFVASPPLRLTTLAYDTYGGAAIPGVGHEVGVALKYKSPVTMFSGADNPLTLAGHQSAPMGLQGVAFSHRGLEASLFERVDIGFGNGIIGKACRSCGSFHMGQTCPTTLALAPYWLDAPHYAGSDWLSLENGSFDKAVMPSWGGWPSDSGCRSAELGDYIVARVKDAVCDAFTSHSLVEGNLIVQVVLLVQAKAGVITQIGKVSARQGD